MKNKMFFAIIFIAFLSSCNDWLEMPEDGRISMTDIFSNFDLTRGYVNKCYSYMPYGGYIGDYAMSYSGTLLASFCDEAEDVQDVQSGNIRNWYLGNVSSNAFPMNDYWRLYYDGIRICNVFLQEIERSPLLVERPNLAGEADDWKAQVYTLRAFYFWQILKRYGPAPIIRKLVENEYDYTAYTRPSFAQCVDSVIADCEKAISYGLMWNTGLGTEGERGRMTRAVAYAIESEAALYASSDLWNSDVANRQAKWERAAVITGKALNECLANTYRLYSALPTGEAAASSANAYQMYFLSRMDMSRTIDRETVLECKAQLAVWRDAGLPLNAGSLRAGSCPSQEMVDAYEMINGTPPFQTDVDGCVIYDVVIPRIYPSSGFNPDKPYENRDPRLTASIYYNGSLLNFTDPNSAINIYQDADCRLSATDLRYTRTGYYLRKFNNNSSDISNQADGYMKIFRLAELYLNFAEAANEAYDPVTNIPGVQGTVLNAMSAVNAVRLRAGMPGFNANGIPTQTEFRKKLRNERRVELAFEQHRFYDVRRWKILDKTDIGVSGVNTTVADENSFSYNRFSIGNRRCNSDKFLLFPLPYDEVCKMEKYTGDNWQNPGW
ncbi:MAG: RagB/SusD family nutrient uptake outer membrane protein [Tannerella sp.]|nr:RagB/SusD family nutrient uptake outer membrane protein [Tannerella sp.]